MIKAEIHNDKQALGRAAAAAGAAAIRSALSERGAANIIVATGASQFEVLDALVREPDIDWSRVTAFHLDEYLGMADTHPASFRKYLKERFTDRLPALGSFHPIRGDAADPQEEISRLGTLISASPIDVTFAGIGENGHLAFNDPPADFETDAAFEIVELDERCRRQQFGEGWFPTFEDVPHRAITMTIPQIMKSRLIVLSVPDERKAEAVHNALEGPVTPDRPASILQKHPACRLFLDPASAGLLSKAGSAGG